MSALSDAAKAIEDAAKQASDKLRAYDLGEEVTPPALVVGPARFQYSTTCGGMAAVFPLWVIVDLNDRSVERLYEYVEKVGEAVEVNCDGVMTGATPGTYSSGPSELPAYELTIEYPA